MSNKCIEIIERKMRELDELTKDYLLSENYTSKCRFTHNVLKDILEEIKSSKGETK